MKILAIRGANLASLEGEFELELADGPLARAGVFAICGATGAGKSTLLDAMCLALFDQAPRLGGRVRVGRTGEDEAERLTTSDPRSILRKGAGSGYAEVDFLGADERRYRARWEVRRARGRVRGKLQPTAMSLLDLEDGRPIGSGRKTDVLDAIEARLGLSFDQFRRSVLLAQNDFAAFLDADAKERAGLLERMTGTEIYGVISMEAHARAGEERRVLEALQERVGRIPVLPEAERAEHQGRLTELERQALADEGRARDAEAAVAWHAQLDGLVREEREAREEHEHTMRQLALAESRRRELEAYEAARPLRPLLEAVDRASARLAERELERTRIASERAERAVLVSERERTAQAAERVLVDAERARTEAAPRLAEARRLDGEVALARQRARERETRADGLAAELARLEQRETEARARLEACRRRADEASSWLGAHAELARAADDWPRHEQRLERLIERVAEQRGLERDARAATQRATDLATAHARQAEGAREAEQHATSAKEAYQRAAEVARRAPSAALSEVRSAWVERRSSLDTMLGVATLAQRAFEAERRQRDAADRAASAAVTARREADAAERAREQAEQKLEEAQRARDALRSTLDLAAHRAELREGEPCPLCGAREHPFARELPLVERLLDEQDARVRALAAERSRLDRRTAEAGEAAKAADGARVGAETEAAHWADELASARARYRAAAERLGADEASWPRELPSMPKPRVDWGPLFAMAGGEADGPLLDATAHAALDGARQAAVKALADLDAEERTRRDAERDAEVARAAFDEAKAAAELAARAAASALEAKQAAERELERLEQARAEAKARVVQALPALVAVLGEATRERLASEPERVLAALRDEVRAWLARSEERARAEDDARSAEPAWAAAREQRDALAEQLAAARHELEAARESHRAVLAARAGLLDGEDADAHERRLEDALGLARSAATEASAALAGMRVAAAEAAAREASAREGLDEAAHELARARGQLAAACDTAGIDEADARARLTREPGELESWRRELEALDTARREQAAVLAERARRREAHELRDPPSLAAEPARQAMTEARQRAASSRELLASTRDRLARDDAYRAELAELEAELAAGRERLAVWEALADLIGSASGAKLRVFAQSLTLELLLEHANHHLRTLAPRYALARVPGEDLALMVIDHEMGDEVRGVGSLSGGESFLVALGMALGLASLSSHRARIGSLFIDEGFGALDPASLDVVLGALDALQASGRQIGVISHVQAMAERFDTRVQVVSAGPARSRVELVEGFV